LLFLSVCIVAVVIVIVVVVVVVVFVVWFMGLLFVRRAVPQNFSFNGKPWYAYGKNEETLR
jgi:uncharacterized membrane protein YqiK